MSKLYADDFKAVLDAFSLVKPVLAAWLAGRPLLSLHSPLTVLLAIPGAWVVRDRVNGDEWTSC